MTGPSTSPAGTLSVNKGEWREAPSSSGGLVGVHPVFINRKTIALRHIGHLNQRHRGDQIHLVDVVHTRGVSGVIVARAREHLPDVVQLIDQSQGRRLDLLIPAEHSVGQVQEPVVDPLVVQVKVQREEALLDEARLAEVTA